MASACIAFNPAIIKGLWQLPFSVLKASFPVLGHPFNFKKANSLTFKHFCYGFANSLPEKEARELWTIPAPFKPLFQAASTSFGGSETNVDTKKY